MSLPLVSPPEPEVNFVRPPAWSGPRGDPYSNSRFAFTPEDIGPDLPPPSVPIEGVSAADMSRVWSLDMYNSFPFTSTQQSGFTDDDARVVIVRAYARF